MKTEELYTNEVATLSWVGASLAVESALSRAERLGIKVNAAVVDRNGNTLAYLRMSGAFLHSEGLAVDKAYTAASFGFATREWMDKIGDDARLRIGITSRPRLVVLGGGVPIILDGVCMGGVGVSGGTEEQDEICANAALEALGLLPMATSASERAR
ncbi:MULTISPECIES: GlcG/HbpS family heme-binding protein [Pseudomonas]|nr:MULTISPECIES: heme-binding protein [Pseudomonas]KRV32165.1 cobalamin adenosyltransferase [Pseudomonas aeruginosa]KSF44341.1 cobalamin adenosyltransferase [Pseudomonas aeruginosa]MBL7228322.1 heme-binding protein [Pseudomonas sp.]MCT5235666.1 heme-binding protein [Pseudomonas aeruginosa]MCV6434593.1 heme-binding protein [Pseudomonas aeruginosa]